MTLAEDLIDSFLSEQDEPVEIAYRIPGKGGFKRKSFKSEKEAEKFVDKLIDKEGKDVEVRWALRY